MPERLEDALAWDSKHPAAAVWRGYVAHALLFYRQNRLTGGFNELVRLGRAFALGPGGAPARRANNLDSLRSEPSSRVEKLVLRGLRKHERYWGSVRFRAASLADFEEAIRLDPACVWARVFAGMTLEMHRRYTRAIRHFDEAARLAPEWAWPLTLRGICKWYLAEFEDSCRDFERAARLDPKSDLPLLFLARAKADLRDRSLVKDLDRALALAEFSSAARRVNPGFALSWRGRALFVLNRTPEALADLRRSIRALPDYDRGYSWLGVSYAERGRWKAAIPLLETARRLNPYYPTTLYPLARSLGKLGRWDRAGKMLREAACIDRAGIWIEHRISMGHPNPAAKRSLRDLDEFLQKRPSTPWALAWRGQTKLLLQDFRGALADLDAAAGLDARDAWTFVFRGEAKRRLGMAEAARLDFTRALALDHRLTWPMAGLGWCALALGRPKEALRRLDRSLALQPRCQPALAWRGEARYALGRWKAAAADFEEALELHPRDHWLYDWLWRARARAGDSPGAREALALLVRDGGARSDQAWALLGWAEARLGRKTDARKALARAKALNPRQEIRPGMSVARIEALRLRQDPSLFFHDPGRKAPGEGRDVQSFLWSGWRKLQAGDRFGAVEDASRALDMTLDPHFAPARWLRQEAAR